MGFCLNEKNLSNHLVYLNKCMQSGTYLVGNSLSFADLFVYSFVENLHQSFDNKNYINIARWFDYIQHYDVLKTEKVSLGLKVDKFVFKPIADLHPKKEEKKPEEKKDAKVEAKPETKQEVKTEVKKEETKSDVKKDEKKKEKKPVEEKKEPNVITQADIRVGKILTVKKHEKADRLYVEEIDVGEEKPRVICSGLVPHMKPEDLQDKLVLVFCNLKPKSAVGIDSFGMVLCATDSETKKVQLVIVPEGTKPGTVVQFGDEVNQPEKQLHERKLKAILEDLKTNSDGEVVFKDLKAKVGGKVCTSNFKNAHVS